MKTRPGDYDVEAIRKIVYERTPPVEMRKNLDLVLELKLAGIDFVPIPIFNEEDKRNMISQLYRRLERMFK